MPKAFDIFFSYDHDDGEWVKRLSSALGRRGFRPWVDSAEIAAATRWAERIEAGLKSSRIYALIATRKALQSRWVSDEYYSALTLANSPGNNLQLVPLLMEDVELPPLLGNRQWIDFRDPEKFDEGLEKLYKCILMARDGDSAETVFQKSESAEDDNEVTLEVQLKYLRSALRRETRTIREMWVVRIAAAAVGFALYSWLVTTGVAPNGLTLAAGNTLFTALIGWGATARQMTATRLSQDRLALLQEGLEKSQDSDERDREKLQTEFWRVVHGDTGLASAR